MFLTPRLFRILLSVILLLCGGYVYGSLFIIGQVAVAVLVVLILADALLLYRTHGIAATRRCAERFSNGDDNSVHLRVDSRYPFLVSLTVIDEIPAIFQRRDIRFTCTLKQGEGKEISYTLLPTQRGLFDFGRIRIFASTRLGLLQRRFSCAEPQTIKVYPSYLMLHHYELLAMSNNLTEMGIKKIRRIGHQTEFEQIKEYVKGDDYRTINWKASARKHELMVNVFQDERSQPIYSVIDKGRVMQHAFRGMTLLDYAINASLVLSYVAMRKEDKAGLVTFSDAFDTFVPASRQTGQMQTLLENLYKQETTFGETDFSALCVHLGKHLSKRSLLILYTNFDSVGSMNRQLPYLQQLARRHRLLVVFFEDVELKAYAEQPATDTESYYRRVIAQKTAYEKRLIVSTLKQQGIYSLLIAPDQLSVGVINKYLELKA
ncbi:DUF58 domain-containing protein [Bacteroides sp.]|uniref:DUF58 domain-containing protein n=2 Tax=Bacteroides sp. TaxID=29523 RepID=UPI002FCBA5DD